MTRSGDEPTPLEIALGLCERGVKFFHDQKNEPFVYFERRGISAPLSSRIFKRLLNKRYVAATRNRYALGSETLNQIILLLENRAFEGPEVEMFVRVGKIDRNQFLYDLGNGQIVQINPDRWEIVQGSKTFPINPFHTFDHQLKQVQPIPGGDPWLLFNAINVPQDLQLLFIVYLISCFIPDFPHPIIHPYGPQGSGKSFLCDVLKTLIDPSSIKNIIVPKKQDDLIQAFSHHCFAVLDNLSSIPLWLSDFLAKIVTGTGFSKRKLYTDDTDVTYQLRRDICVNGISVLTTRPDLMERTILLPLDRITSVQRQKEDNLTEEFDRIKPEILGGIFDAIAKAMLIYPTVKLKELPRMADFAQWGYAIAKALGREGEDFLIAYRANQEIQAGEVIGNNTLAQAVIKLIEETECWEDTVQETYKKLKLLANMGKNDRSDTTFPNGSNQLRSHLDRLKVSLKNRGIEFVMGSRSNKTKEGVPITIRRIGIEGQMRESSSSLINTETAIPRKLEDLDENERMSYLIQCEPWSLNLDIPQEEIEIALSLVPVNREYHSMEEQETDEFEENDEYGSIEFEEHDEHESDECSS